VAEARLGAALPTGPQNPKSIEEEAIVVAFRRHTLPLDELHERATARAAADFLETLIKAVPYKVLSVLTDNGIQFTDLPKNRAKTTAMWRGHPFDRSCRQHSIEHRLTKPNHPWTKGQVE
jgi:transposase InsO family protein